MSLRRRDRVDPEIDLKAVISFLHMLLCMAVGIMAVAILGMVVSALAGQELIIYQMTLAVNVVMLGGGSLALRKLRWKSFELEEKNDAVQSVSEADV